MDKTNSYYFHCKSAFMDNMVLTLLCIFVVIFIIINYNTIMENNNFTSITENYGNFGIVQPLLITAIIALLAYLFITWDDNDVSENVFINEIPAYKISNKINLLNENKYRIINSVENKLDKLKLGNLNKSLYNVEDNSNIFISQKNAGKFGLKF